MKQIIAFLTIALAVSCPSRAQEPGAVAVIGIVLDRETGNPIPVASVSFPDDRAATITDDDGVFHTTLTPGGHVIEISRTGYERLEDVIAVSDSAGAARYFLLTPRVYQMEGITVQSGGAHSLFESIRRETDVLSGRELQREAGVSLAETIKNQSGMAMRSMGPAPARPVVRGLSGDRVVIARNGVAAQDLSATAPDHAVTVEPYTIDSVEIIRGPEVLLYSPVTIGGVIDTRTESIPHHVPESITGSTGVSLESARPGGLGAASATIPFGRNAFHGETSWRRNGEEHTPAGALPNTMLANRTYTAGATHLFAHGFAGVSLDSFDSDYGIPGGFIGGHPNGVDIDMLRRSLRFSSSWEAARGPMRTVDLDLDRTYYTHTEYESAGQVGAEFLQRHYTARAQLTFDTMSREGNTVLAVEYTHRDLQMGGYVFTAPTRSNSAATALYHEWTVRDVEYRAGVRYDHVRYDPRPVERDSDIGRIDSRIFDTVSVSGAALYPFTSWFTAGASLSRSARTPTIEELYNEGPHLAAYSYETGNPSLGVETGVGAELFGYWNTPRVTVVLTGYVNTLDSYITFRNTGEINWQQILPIYRADAVAARIAGFESTVRVQVTQTLSLDLNASWVRGQNRTDHLPLPLMPPLKVLADLHCECGPLVIGAESESAASQTRLDRFEEETAGYSILRPYIEATFFQGKMVHRVMLSIDNLFDTAYRNHLSRIKSIMPETGRNVRLNYRMYF